PLPSRTAIKQVALLQADGDPERRPVCLPSRILTSAISAANQISGAKRGATGGRHWGYRAAPGDDQSPLAGTSGDSERRPATVGLRHKRGVTGSNPVCAHQISQDEVPPPPAT